MKLLKSKKGIPIPKLYFITEAKDILKIPKGVPYFYASPDEEEYIIRILEYEVLYKNAKESGLPFNFRKILEENGFSDLNAFSRTKSSLSARLNLRTEDKIGLYEIPTIWECAEELRDFITDSSVYVDINRIKDLNLFPVWLTKIEDAVSRNIHNYATYDTNLYNKKLGGMFGGISFKSPTRNLIVIDISGSIPRGVSATALAMAKNLSQNFYADLLITGSKSTLYDFEEVHDLDVSKVYRENGMDNDQVYFKKLVSEPKKYATAIVFGDDHTPGYDWSNQFNRGTTRISKEDGQELCKWEIEKIISFHTESGERVAGYADWFTTDSVEYIEDWVDDLEE